jgi:phenylpyruvate tautomerase PptA (4-oxalocrotonate tautomerase family)
MPSALIEVRKTYSQLEQETLIDRVHAAMMSALKIKPADRVIRLIAHEPHCFACPHSLKCPELFTLNSIDAFSGRSLDTKRNLYQSLVNELSAFGVPKDHILILFRESPAENWGVQGGQAACDVDLGFEIRV